MAVTSRRLTRFRRTPPEFIRSVRDHLYYSQGAALHSASLHDLYMAVSYAVRDHLVERWARTVEVHHAANPKFVYYLSLEYLLGRQLPANLFYTGLDVAARRALRGRAQDFSEFLALDPEPGLGNGGLGRLAACLLDSLATLDIPAVGYGLRYEYGIFNQTLREGWQVEQPDSWLRRRYPWEFLQPDDALGVGFYGHTERYVDGRGRRRTRWVPRDRTMGEPHHVLIPGYRTGTVNILRLWRARATEEFDVGLFNDGDYARAVAKRVSSEDITRVLYPSDSTPQGRELRLKQQYFFVACSLRDIIRRFHLRNTDWEDFPRKVVIHLNDTHPVVAIPELMRLLMDDEGMIWERAWEITTQVFAYTCHTLLPEALETWPVDLFGAVLPRHLEIVQEIDRKFRSEVLEQFPWDDARADRMSIIGDSVSPHVRMAHLAAVGSSSVNGVAPLHSTLLQEHTLRDFAEMWPERFQNKTNGVTPRRFIHLANPRLSALITSVIGSGWLTDLDNLAGLEAFVDDEGFRSAWRDIKRQNKRDLAAYLLRHARTTVDPESVFDVMVKRLHEYKRQLLKVLHVITLYHRLKDAPGAEMGSRTVIFSGKAAPGYLMAKRIIKLINNVAAVVNRDPDTRGRLTVVFLENFNVSLAERIYPAADISEQISTAGKEASGTGNMKFALNGAVTVGTLDGANIEILERVGTENFFVFGLTAGEVTALKQRGYNPFDYYDNNPALRRAIDSIASGEFSEGDPAVFEPIVRSLLEADDYLSMADYQSYVDCCERAAHAYGDQDTWTRMSILNVARSGYFSSDRVVREYAKEIWRVDPVPIP